MRAYRSAHTLRGIMTGDRGLAVQGRLAEQAKVRGNRRGCGKGQGDDQDLGKQGQTGQRGQRYPFLSQQMQQ